MQEMKEEKLSEDLVVAVRSMCNSCISFTCRI